ncbi:MAG: SMP-30/gluconolactonase/LRE family protein [Bryobacteraceae bacterium]
MNVELIADFNDLCGECPIWDSASASLYWTDCAGSRFYHYNPRNGQAAILRTGVEVNGFRFNRSGGFVVSNSSGVWLWPSPDAELVPVVSQVDGRPCRLNDCAADPAGRLLTGSLFYHPAHDYPLGQLISIGTNGVARVLDEGYHLSNGIAFSPDGSLLYATDSVSRRIYEYDYDLRSGTASNRRVRVQVPRDQGVPDGLRVDTSGFLWSAQWYGSCVVRYDPEGTEERRIPVPAKQTSCVTFGGPDLTTLYITTAGLSEPMPVMPPGYDAVEGQFGGPLYRIEVEIQGLPDLPADIVL